MTKKSHEQETHPDLLEKVQLESGGRRFDLSANLLGIFFRR
jgi:hypothetical protein